MFAISLWGRIYFVQHGIPSISHRAVNWHLIHVCWMNDQLFAAVDKRKGYVFPAGQSLSTLSSLQPGLRVLLTAGLLTGCKWYTLVSATSISRKKRVGRGKLNEKSTEYKVLVPKVLNKKLELQARVGLCCVFHLMGVFFSPEENYVLLTLPKLELLQSPAGFGEFMIYSLLLQAGSTQTLVWTRGAFAVNKVN